MGRRWFYRELGTQSKFNGSSSVTGLSEKFLLFLLSLLLVFSLCSCLGGVTIKGRVVDVDDGDTITVLAEDKYYYKIRLMSIDAPETRRNAKFKKDITQVYQKGEYNVFIRIPPADLLRIGHEAKYRLFNIVYGKSVKVEIEGVDRYKRALGWVWLNGTLINEYMVANGLARPYMVGGKYWYRIREAERVAKQKKVGIYR